MKKQNSIPIQLLQVIDGLVVFIAFLLVVSLRVPFRFLFGLGALEVTPPENGILFISLAVLLVPIVLELLGFYLIQGGFWRKVRIIMGSVLLASGIVLTLMVVTKFPIESRFLFLSLPPLIFVLLLLRSVLFVLYYSQRARSEARRKSVQLFGSQSEVDEFLNSLSREQEMSWDIQEVCSLEETSIRDLIELLERRSVAVAIFLSRKTAYNRVSRAVELCESMGVEALVATDFLRAKLSVLEIELVGGRTMMVLRSTPSISHELVAKRLLDRLGSLLLIGVTFPLWILAIVGIKWNSPQGKVFFRQKRAGLYGREFLMWKFRSMHPNAEKELGEVKAASGNEMSGPVFKLENDPRVFPFGDFLRRTSIDELPQLINVMRGEMSLVGPRPLPIYEVVEFQKSEHRRRLSVKPGITCLWQAGGRNAISDFEEWVALDLKYIDNWSFLLDLKILLKTIPAVFLKKGAK